MPVPVIKISDDGSSTAGENFTLTCTASVIEGLTDDALISISWIDSDIGDTVQSNAIQLSDVNKTSILEFDPINLSHGGHYTCNASITIPIISTVQISMESYNIITNSECHSDVMIIL